MAREELKVNIIIKGDKIPRNSENQKIMKNLKNG